MTNENTSAAIGDEFQIPEHVMTAPCGSPTVWGKVSNDRGVAKAIIDCGLTVPDQVLLANEDTAYAVCKGYEAWAVVRLELVRGVFRDEEGKHCETWKGQIIRKGIHKEAAYGIAAVLAEREATISTFTVTARVTLPFYAKYMDPNVFVPKEVAELGLKWKLATKDKNALGKPFTSKRNKP
jgi:hypothetical protein